MRINPKLANLQYMYANGDATSGLPEGTYSNLAAAKYVKDNDKDKDKCLTIDEVTLSQEAFDKLDADKNGKIDLSEMKDGLKGQDAAIQAYYTNRKASSKNDNTTSLLEDSAGSLTDTYANLAAAKYIKENDKDGNSTLSSTEAGLSAKAFDKLDTDGNGVLSQKEIRAGLTDQESTVEAFYETNGTSSSISNTLASLLENTKLTPAASDSTYSAKAAVSFVTNKDADKDGSLSRTEAALSTTAFDKLDTDKDGTLELSEVQAAIKAKESNYKTYYANNISSSTINSYTSSLLKTI
ncbi:MAG: EF-hand domain-containing protein [Proteobacteria bacterium]|nr:EF-hand domain-containing protein [Pseudomonadota bacterium]